MKDEKLQKALARMGLGSRRQMGKCFAVQNGGRLLGNRHSNSNRGYDIKK